MGEPLNKMAFPRREGSTHTFQKMNPCKRDTTYLPPYLQGFLPCFLLHLVCASVRFGAKEHRRKDITRSVNSVVISIA